MPLSRAKNRERMQRLRQLGIQSVISPADVRAMRAAGIDPEYVENESGKVSSRVYYALMRDRDAIKAHLSWLQDDLKSGRIVLNGQYHEQRKETEGIRETSEDKVSQATSGS